MTSRELTKKLVAKSLICLYATGTLISYPGTLSALAKKNKNQAAAEEHVPSVTERALAVDSDTLALINRGDWQGVAERLGKLSSGTTATKSDAWLIRASVSLSTAKA